MDEDEPQVDGAVAVLIPSLDVANVYGFDHLSDVEDTLPMLVAVRDAGGDDYLQGVPQPLIAGVEPDKQKLAWLGICLLLGGVLADDDKRVVRWRNALIPLMPVRHYCLQVLGDKDRPEITIFPLAARTREGIREEVTARALQLCFRTLVSAIDDGILPQPVLH